MAKTNNTIAAISTAMSNSGIGIVRISGDNAIKIANDIFESKTKKSLLDIKTHTLHYGFICDKEEVIDEVLVSVMKAPKTYTGEDIVEINCHGGVYVTKKILEIVVSKGASIAEPGEFTKRAFLNGRIDLSQAEAVNDIITSQNAYALKAGVSGLRGKVKEKIDDIRSRVINSTAYIETALDDPEHFDLTGYGDELREKISEIIVELDKLISSSDDGRMLREGIQTVIVGKPNAGKSSLLNAMLGEERAIVTDIEGTTRDILSEYINLGGITLHMIDTAGIRETSDIIEKIGVDKAREYVDKADLVLYVIDVSSPLDKNDIEIMRMIAKKHTIILLNKSDLEAEIDENDIRMQIFASNPAFTKEEENFEIAMIMTSAKEEKGIDRLVNEIKTMFFAGNLAYNDEIYITNERQKASLIASKTALEQVIEGIDMGMSEDFYTIDLMDAYEELGNILGESIGEDLINEIFGKFCVGK